jgi:hypothetical protein
MKTKTEKILVVMKYLALLGAIGFSIECGSQIVSLIATFINPEWAKQVYHVDQTIFSIREVSTTQYIYAMSIVIAVLVLKANIWYSIFYLLEKLELKSPFTLKVIKKLERIACLLLGIWVITGIIGKTYSHYLMKSTGIQLSFNHSGDAYLFIAGIVYIIAQIFRRGIEMQEENALTV